MSDEAKKFLIENKLDNLPRIGIDDYPKFRGKYVFILHDYNPFSRSIFEGGSNRIVVNRMHDFRTLVAAGARVVDGIFYNCPWSIEGGFKRRLGDPKYIDENYVIYTIKAIKNSEFIDIPHGFVKDPFDKTFMKHMHDGDRATLENIIIHEKNNQSEWSFENLAKWWDYEQSKLKSEKLLKGFDAFVWATTLLCSDKKAALNILRYARETMPCFLDSYFEYYYGINSQPEPYIPSTVQVRVWKGTDLVEEWDGKKTLYYRSR
ncbi:MAG: hypothetical protein J6T57_04495 [Alphaproteobacteria bacterium]|nr:hypothetical protein [Alphaproteobacteria bacterium]